MCITIDETIDQHTREHFETVLPDGSVSQAFIDAGGSRVIMPGRIEPQEFVQEANALIALSAEAGLLADDTKLFGRRLTARQVLHTVARPELDEIGLLVLDWNVVAGQPGVIDVTVVEA